MENDWKISYKQIALLFGFLFLFLGLLGIIQIGLLESLLAILPFSLIILLIGIVLLILVLVKKLEN